MMRARLFLLPRRIRHDRDGTAVMEFGFIAPVFLLLIMGLFDLGHFAYTKSVLNGAVQEAARLSALESGDTATADAYVTDIVRTIAPEASVVTSRVSYFDFADIARPEAWDDADNSGDCNDGESYTDENANGSWDEDVGASGNGGANDVVIYTVVVNYDPPFGMPLLPTDYTNRRLEASAINKNQPFAQQTGYSSTAATCE